MPIENAEQVDDRRDDMGPSGLAVGTRSSIDTRLGATPIRRGEAVTAAVWVGDSTQASGESGKSAVRESSSANPTTQLRRPRLDDRRRSRLARTSASGCALDRRRSSPPPTRSPTITPTTVVACVDCAGYNGVGSRRRRHGRVRAFWFPRAWRLTPRSSEVASALWWKRSGGKFCTCRWMPAKSLSCPALRCQRPSISRQSRTSRVTSKSKPSERIPNTTTECRRSSASAAPHTSSRGRSGSTCSRAAHGSLQWRFVAPVITQPALLERAASGQPTPMPNV
jgi:hypothetical protein